MGAGACAVNVEFVCVLSVLGGRGWRFGLGFGVGRPRQRSEQGRGKLHERPKGMHVGEIHWERAGPLIFLGMFSGGGKGT